MLELGTCIEDICRRIDEKIIARKEILFMPIPYYYKKYDGTLYNMQYGMGAITKSEDVLNTFKEVKEDIALIGAIDDSLETNPDCILENLTKEYLKVLKYFEIKKQV